MKYIHPTVKKLDAKLQIGKLFGPCMNGLKDNSCKVSGTQKFK